MKKNWRLFENFEEKFDEEVIMKTKNQPEVKFKEPEERIFGEPLKKSSRVERKKKKFHLWKFWKRNQDSRLNSCLKEENRTDSPTYQRKVLKRTVLVKNDRDFFQKNFRNFFENF